MSIIVTDDAALRALVAEEVDRAVAPVLAAIARLEATRGAGGGDGLLTADEVVELLRVDRRTLRRMVLAGEVPAPITIGARTIRWRRRSLEAWLSKLERKALDGSARGRLHGAVNVQTAARTGAAG